MAVNDIIWRKKTCRTDTCNGGSLSVTCWQSHYFMANIGLGGMTSSGPGQHLGLRRAASWEEEGCLHLQTAFFAFRPEPRWTPAVFHHGPCRHLPSSVRRKLALTLPTPNRFRLAPSQPKSFTGPSITSVSAHTAFQTAPV